MNLSSQSSSVAVVGSGGFLGGRIVATLTRDKSVVHELRRGSHGNFQSAKPSWFADSNSVVYAAGVVPARMRPGKDLASNATTARAVCEAARDAGVKQFVLVSSASVYGVNHEAPVTEESPLAPDGEYGQTCVEVESIATSILHDVKLTIVRPFSVYGPGGHGLVDRLLNAVRDDTAVELFAPDSVRDYIHVDDVAQSVVQLIGHPGIFNLGTGIGRTTREVVEMAKTAHSSLESLITWKDAPTRARDTSVADTKLANQVSLPIKDRLQEYLQGALS